MIILHRNGRVSALVTLGYLTAACQSEPMERSDNRVEAVQPRLAATPSDAMPRRSPASKAAPAPTQSNAQSKDVALTGQAAEVRLAVDGEGLRLVEARSGSTRPLAFGLSSGAVLGPLEKLRGPAGKGINSDCGSDYANWADGLSLSFRRGKFVGWSVDGRSEGAIATMTGLGTGSTRASLGAYDYKVVRTSLGSEFTAGDVHGLLSSGAGDATVTYIWAGEVCIAR